MLFLLFPSQSDAAAASSTIHWISLKKLVGNFDASSQNDALETIVSHCPALTELNLMHGNPENVPPSFGLSVPSLDAFAAHLLTLSLNMDDQRQMDLLEQLSLRAPHITDLKLDASFMSCLRSMHEVLPRFSCLTSFSIDADSFSINMDSMLIGLNLQPMQLRSLVISSKAGINWYLLLALLNYRPKLDTLHVFVIGEPPRYARAVIHSLQITHWICDLVQVLGAGVVEADGRRERTRSRQIGTL